jgi:hypothetical protein
MSRDKVDLDIFRSIVNLCENKKLLVKYICQYIGNYDLVKLLIENGADIKYEWNPLKDAIAYNILDVSKLLLENGATTHYLNVNLYEIVFTNNYEMIELLLNYHILDENELEIFYYSIRDPKLNKIIDNHKLKYI